MLDFLDVLNLVINGIPSILRLKDKFNSLFGIRVLNLVINGIPSILLLAVGTTLMLCVLNLVINGIPSIQSID